MVSADSLNLDVLEVIFAHLSGKDLPAVALVSRSFLAGVIPRLYRTLAFRIHHAKRYPKVTSAFSAVLAHPHLGVHVRNIDIRVVPTVLGEVNPMFVRDCCQALELCFRGKASVGDIRMNGRLTIAQAEKLLKLTKIQRITLDFGSWTVMDILPKWTMSIRKTLTNLTLFMSNELNEQVLESALSELPQLLGLHIVGCSQINHITVLRLVIHTPLLQSLAFTATEFPHPLEVPPPALYHLQHIAIDTRPSITSPSPPEVLPMILAHLKTCHPPLSSFALKAPELPPSSSYSVIVKLLEAHAQTLKKLSFFDCSIGLDSVTAIAESCTHLEQLGLPLPIKELAGFTRAVSRSESLQSLVDIDTHISHDHRPSLKEVDVRDIMTRVPTLRKVVSDKRIWTGQDVAQRLQISFDRQPIHGPSTHWFLHHD